MIKFVDIDGGYKTIIIYGSETPIGSRIGYYLENYANAIGYGLNIVLGQPPYRTPRVQREIWETYVGEGGTSRPDLIVNAFVFDDLEYAEADASYSFSRNTHTAGILALAARAAEIPMIQISTDHVFKGDHGPYGLAHHRHPINIFGLSMKLAEDVVCGYVPNDHLIIRMSQVHGPEIVYKRASYAGQASYAFIGDVAFLVARNVISSPRSLLAGTIHCGPSDEPFYMDDRGVQSLGEHSGYMPKLVSVGDRRGLIPTPGWVLPPHSYGLQKALEEEKSSSGFIAYWEPGATTHFSVRAY